MIEFIQAGWNAPGAIRACCTTRIGGSSQGAYASFNLGLHVGDEEQRVRDNRQRLRGLLQLPNEPCWIRQTHGTRVVTLETDDGRDADASITRRPGTVAVVTVADCLPILLSNRAGTEVAAVHAGWRGLQAGIIKNTLAQMHSAAADLIAWIGPGISRDFFEVGADVYSAYHQTIEAVDPFFSPRGADRWLCDLAGIAELVLTRHGVAEVTRTADCSYRDSDRYYSYRRDAVTGRMAALIWINREA